MTKLFTRSLMAVAVAVLAGAEALVPAVAQAQSIQLDLNSPRPGVRLVEPDNGGRRVRSDEDMDRRGCSSDDALDKADRMGIRRARVVAERRRSIDVAGRRDGERVVVTFARDRRCSVLD